MARRAGSIGRIAASRDARKVRCDRAGCLHTRVPSESGQHESSKWERWNLLVRTGLLDNSQGRVIVGGAIAILIDELDVPVITGPARSQSRRADIDRRAVVLAVGVDIGVCVVECELDKKRFAAVLRRKDVEISDVKGCGHDAAVVLGEELGHHGGDLVVDLVKSPCCRYRGRHGDGSHEGEKASV